MSDHYQAVYDAVRSRISGCNVEQTVKAAIPTLDTWSIQQAFVNAAQDIAIANTRPSIVLKAGLSLDGNQWCALYGENLQEGLAGFGDTPEKAMLDFDRNYYHQPAPPAKAHGCEVGE